ncbi:MAG: helix-turn-helix transcriptional regulator [Rikenellaceae bacterium]|nr:helix-turn-helix transcriptional regulator [Rikenellaceae bacterium]
MYNITIQELGYQVKIHREQLGLSQKQLADQTNGGINRSNIAHLEQGRKLPYDSAILEKICLEVKLPRPIWEQFLNEKSKNRLLFERLLNQLSGESVSTFNLDQTIISVIEDKIDHLFKSNLTPEQSFDCLNSIIVYYGLLPLSKVFFNRYIGKDSFKSSDSFEIAILKFQKEAIRLFSSINEAYTTLNSTTIEQFDNLLAPIQLKDTDGYTTRTEWDKIDKIPNKDLPFLGYIAADKVRREEKERKELANFLIEIADKKEAGEFNIEEYSNKKKKRMDSLLRDFKSTINNGLFSPLFNPDIETLRKEAEYISPENDENLSKMEITQKKAYHNLSNYLAADYMDVYVATSMRNNADFVSVNQFVETLFSHCDVRQLKLRYFNPTQSWIEDRVAKGLVEALMLKRADLCIYMAQKEDTFGKDSEASVTLGQGKPVIVYVPKLFDSNLKIDSEKFGRMGRNDLIEEINKIGTTDIKNEIDELEDNEAIHSTLLHKLLEKADKEDYVRIIKKHWADFDIEGEFEKRLTNNDCSLMKKWLQEILSEKGSDILTEELILKLKDILVAIAMRFERRAKVFREVHPLALQIILSSGVLNGILVVRSIDSCAKLVNALIENNLELEITEDDDNYKLIEKNTLSTIRVISKHRLIANSFKTFFKKHN